MLTDEEKEQIRKESKHELTLFFVLLFVVIFIAIALVTWLTAYVLQSWGLL